MEFKETLKKLRKERKITQEQLAKEIGVERSSIGKYESTNTIPSNEVLKNLSKYFGVSIDFLLGNSIKQEYKTKTKGIKIPVYGNVAAGIPISAIEDIVDFEEISEELAASGEYFGLIIKGDSMEPRMTTGDVVIVRSQPTAETGDIAIALIGDNDATCKKIKKTPEGIMLISLNPNYEPMFYSKKEIEQLPIRIIGKVIELRAKF